MHKTILLILFLKLFFLTLISSFKSSVEKTPDGGYTGIVVRIESKVPSSQCPIILKRIESLFQDSSEVLREALADKVRFKSFTVVVPSSWRGSDCQMTLHRPKGSTKYRSTDLYIRKEPGKLSPDTLSTQQSQSCGKPGDFMSLPYEFLVNWNQTLKVTKDPAKLFIREWAKYRYGVFDESGFVNDEIYPHYYNNPNDSQSMLPTANGELIGHWVNSNDQSKSCSDFSLKNCIFIPILNQDKSCSLSSEYYWLPSIKKFCSSIDIRAPSKHGTLCQGKSSLEIIKSHPDFKDSNFINGNYIKERYPPTKMTVVQEPEIKYILLMETSAAMDSGDQWRYINKAAQKFIRYDLPIDSYIGIATFSNESKIEHQLIQIHTDHMRNRIADTLPDKYHLSQSDVKCLYCGFQTVIQDMLASDFAGAHIIIISRGSTDSLSLSEEKEIYEYVKYYDLQVSTILIPDESNKQPLKFFDSISQDSGGQSIMVNSGLPNVPKIKIYLDLMEAFHSFLGFDILPSVVHEKLVEMNSYSSSGGSFSIESFLGYHTKFGVYVEDEEDHLIKSVTFRDSNEYVYGPYTSMSSKYDIINLKTINYPVGEAPPFDDESQLGKPWKYEIQWYSGGYSRQKSAVRVVSRPRYDLDTVTVKVWTNTEASSSIITSEPPIIVYAQVLKGTSSPVLDASVTVKVEITKANGSRVYTPINLLDNGNGDPDITGNDGIYSRYLTDYHFSGRYNFVATVNDNGGRAYTINGKASVCCGSSVRIPIKNRIYSEAFEKVSQGPILHLVSVPEGQDRMPPARIGDLKIKILSETKSLLATWTAPGDDYDTGMVTGYRLVYADDPESLIRPKKSPPAIVGFSKSDLAGVSVSHQFEFPHLEKTYWIGVEAFDDKDNTSPLSNLVGVRLSSESISPRHKPISAGFPSDPETEEETMLIGILIGTFLFLAFILWIGIWLYKRKHPSTTKNGGVNVNIEPGKKYESGSTPMYWSASHLLDEHEQRSVYGDTVTSVRLPYNERDIIVGYDPRTKTYDVSTAKTTTIIGPPISDSLIANTSRLSENSRTCATNTLIDYSGIYAESKKEKRSVTHV